MTAIRVELRLDDGSFVSGMLRSGQSLASFQRELARVDPHFAKSQKSAAGFTQSIARADVASKGMLSTLRDLSIVGGFAAMAFSSLTGASGGMIGSIIKTNAEMQKLRFQMEGMEASSNGVANAAKNVAYLREMATRAPFSLKELNSTFVKLKATGTDPLGGSMQALVDGIAAFGGSDEQLHRVTLGITQMSGKGVIQMEEMRQQLGESMPSAMKLMARSMGVSVGELTKAISTGRVEAGAALTAFYAELERTYGGEAQRMMGTFSGQMALLTANMQNLSTSGGLEAFFQTVEGNLRKINDFMESDSARVYADMFGQSLVTMMNATEATLRMMIEFRSELLLVAKALAGVLIVTQIGRALGFMGLQLTMLRGSLQVFNANMIAAGSNLALFGSGVTQAGTRLIGMQFGLLGVAAGIRGIAGAMMAVAPYLIILGTGIAILGEKMGWFGDKTADAYDELVKFGAETRAQAQATINARKKDVTAEVDALRAKLAREEANPSSGAEDPFYEQEIQDEIDAKLKQLKEIEDQSEDILLQSANREEQVARDKMQRRIEALDYENTKVYREEAEALADRYDLERNEALKRGEGTKEIDEKFNADRKAMAEKQSRDRIDYLTAELDALNMLNKNLTPAQRAAAQPGLEYLGVNIEDEKEKLRQLRMMSDGISMMQVGVDEGKSLTRAENTLDGLKDKITDLGAELKGASGEYAKMQQRIERGDFGTIEEGGEATKKLHKELLAATQQAEALDKVVNGNKKFDADMANLEAKIRADELALKERQAGRKLTDSEKMLAGLNAGEYDGLGSRSNIEKALVGVNDLTRLQTELAAETATVMGEQTFGDTMVNKIHGVAEAINGIGAAMQNVMNFMSSADFSSFGAGFGAGFSGVPNVNAKVDGGILDLIASVESGGDYNATLENGKYTGGDRDLTSMTLNQVRALQAQMLKVPGNPNSSALGKYQIVGKTLQSLMDTMGLSGNELYDPAMQERMAGQLLRGRGRNAGGLRNEWEGLRGVTDEQIYAAYDRSAGAGGARPMPVAPRNTPSAATAVIDSQLAKTKEGQEELARKAARELRVVVDNDEADLSDAVKTLRDEIANSDGSLEELGSNYQKFTDAIRSGAFGSSAADKDVNNQRFAELLKIAKEKDVIEKDLREQRTAYNAVTEKTVELEAQRKELLAQTAENIKRAENPDYIGQSADLQTLNKELTEYLLNVEKAYGKNSPQYATALGETNKIRGAQGSADGSAILADMSAETRAVQDSLLTQDQMRAEQFNRDMIAIDARAQAMRASGLSEVQITEATEAAKAAIRAKYAQDDSGLSGQFAEWVDLQKHLKDGAMEWTDSLATGVAGLIRGTGDLSSVLNGVLDDLANMGVKFLMGGIGNGLGIGGGGPGAGGGGKKAIFSKLAGVATGVPIAHTGGIIGNLSRGISVHPGVFQGAARFHSGGVIGGLKSGEVPIVGMKGEGVFTKDQMKSMAPAGSGGQVITINSPVTVNASGGAPEQNADLAKQISREIEGSMRATIITEIQRQSRPGAALRRGG